MTKAAPLSGIGVTDLTSMMAGPFGTWNLKSPKGRDVARKLIATADIVVANYRPGGTRNRTCLGHHIEESKHGFELQP